MTWSADRLQERIEELRGADVPRCKVEDVVQAKDANGKRIELPDAIEEEPLAQMAERLSHFAAPLRDDADVEEDGDVGRLLCLCCRAQLWGFLGSFTWGIVHGSGSCAECGWPVTMYHREPENKDGWSLTYPLCAHPSEVSTKKERSANGDSND